ncbi:hypothetical protein, partial [Pseudoalteromonas sp. SIMBA_162]|uniref:hypothetical protein n=1 Tax=Pseudoalteromonas sp. SIMBA_162 TaxID=3080867 RepID=UPI00397C6A0B
MKIGRMFSWTFMLMLSFVLFLPSLTAHASDRVYHIVLEDEVEKGLHAYLKRAFSEAVDAKAKTVILEIHTLEVLR